MITDPDHESPDLIDQRQPDDPTRFDPKPGDPSVKPGILLPPTLPEGATIGPDGALVIPDPPPRVVTVPETTITPRPRSRAGGVVLLVIAGGAALLFAARRLLRTVKP